MNAPREIRLKVIREGMMLRILQSIFGTVQKGRYDESVVKAAIERAVDSTDPWLRAVSGYKKKLRPAVVKSIDHVISIVDEIPPPIKVTLSSYTDDPHLRTFFISQSDMQKTIGGDTALTNYLRTATTPPERVFALLAMEKEESRVLCNEVSGDFVVRDVPRITVSFEAHRLIDPTENEEETRRHLMRRAFDHLLGMALTRISILKSTREVLERHRELLQAKRNLLERNGWGFTTAASGEKIDNATIEKQLAEIEADMMELGGENKEFDSYLEIVIEILSQPEKHLWPGKEHLIVDRLGIKREQPDVNVAELTLNELYNSENRRIVMALVELPGGAVA